MRTTLDLPEAVWRAGRERAAREGRTLTTVLRGLESLLAPPSLVMLGEGPRHGAALRRAVLGGAARGNLVFDAHLAALALVHGVSEFWTDDRDLFRFPGLRVRDPFTGAR